LVGSIERLNLLAVLTVVDIKSVGPGIWNDWKGVLLRNLYAATANYLQGKSELAPQARAEAAREQLQEKLSKRIIGNIGHLLSDLPNSYWLNFDMEDLLRHSRFFDQVAQDELSHAVQTRMARNRDITELWVLTKDRHGLFADLTKAISSTGASITGAQLSTSATGRIMDVFYLQNSEGLAFGRENNHALEILQKRAQSVIEDKAVDQINIPTGFASSRAGAIPVVPRIRFVQNRTGGSTILEIQARDRPGLLHDIACILRDAGVEAAGHRRRSA